MQSSKCLICHKILSSSRANGIFSSNVICKYCQSQMQPCYERFSIYGIKGLSVYYYEDFIKDLLLKVKVSGDKELAKALLSPSINYLKCLYEGYTLIPIPSVESSNKKRGFNHVIELFKELGLPINNVLFKKETWKQSDKSYFSRLQIKDVIGIKFPLNPSKKYLLVDDIITTSSTMKSCIYLLKANNIKNLKVLVIAKNKKTEINRKSTVDL